MSKALIISANFCTKISDNLEKSAIGYLEKKKIGHEIVNIPGAFEIPAILSFFAKKKLFDLYVILGCVIRGETSHYDNIIQEVFRAITGLVIQHELASGLGVVTTENYEQAIERSTGIEKNSGLEAAKAALYIMQLYKSY